MIDEVLNLNRRYFCGCIVLLLMFFNINVQAAAITDIRSSISPARVRIVLDSLESINFEQSKNGMQLTVVLPESSTEKKELEFKDAYVKRVRLLPVGTQAAKLVVDLNRDCQYKVYQLKTPNRLVIDIYRINIMKQIRQLAKGVSYTFMQDEMNGRQVQTYVVSVAPESYFELRPFSAAGTYNGRGLLSQQAAQRGMLAAVNASYFDSDGWVIGNVKDNGSYMAVDGQPRSGYAATGALKQIIPDIAYRGSAVLPNGRKLKITGMNRSRISNDLILFNSYYAPTTKTNIYGREVKLKNGNVVAVSTAGNMPIEADTVVLSGHGTNAAALADLKIGDYVILEQSLGSETADKADIVVSGGPLLLAHGRVNVRTEAENIAPDISRGRAPRTALGIKKDGTVLLVVVDGRNSFSSGMTLTELAQYMLRLGADSALNFDGGGSSEMVINGKLVNMPSDGRERRVSVGLGLLQKSEMLVK